MNVPEAMFPDENKKRAESTSAVAKRKPFQNAPRGDVEVELAPEMFH